MWDSPLQTLCLHSNDAESRDYEFYNMLGGEGKGGGYKKLYCVSGQFTNLFFGTRFIQVNDPRNLTAWKDF